MIRVFSTFLLANPPRKSEVPNSIDGDWPNSNWARRGAGDGTSLLIGNPKLGEWSYNEVLRGSGYLVPGYM